MLGGVVVGAGVVFDGRSVMVSLAGLFFGPWSAGVACLMTIPLRMVQGGPGAIMGVSVLLLSAGVGIGFHRSLRERNGEFSIRELLVFGILVHVGMLAMTGWLPAGMTVPVLKRIALPVMLIYPMATVLVGKILSDQAVQDRLVNSLREERERLAGILKGTHAGTWEWNVQTGELLLNERWAEIIGYTLEDLAPVSVEAWQRFCHPEDLKASGELLERHFRGEADYYEIEVRMKHRDGHWVWVLDRGRVTSWTPDGKPLMVMGTHQDISSRKQAESEKDKLEEDLRQSQKMESVGRLAGGVAHDFNNILTVILGHSEMALEQAGPEHPLHPDLEEIHKAAKRSADLTRQLLAFARKQTVVPQVLDLNQTVEGMLHMLKRLIGEGIELAFLPEASLWRVRMDPSQIDQVLVNLCANARDSFSGIGRVEIRTQNAVLDEANANARPGCLPGDYVCLSVRDNGKGMDRETLGRIFEPFFTTKERGEGIGLGLATIYGIVKQNGGFIQVESEVEVGTAFYLYLPRHAGDVDDVRPDVSATDALQGNETILLVEDEEDILNMIREMIQRLGYTVLAARSPAEALRLGGEHGRDIHLLLTDVIMPGMNGKDLSQKLQERHACLKTLYMSGYTADVIGDNGMLQEGVHFISKPFSGAELAAKIRSVLDG